MLDFTELSLLQIFSYTAKNHIVLVPKAIHGLL